MDVGELKLVGGGEGVRGDGETINEILN